VLGVVGMARARADVVECEALPMTLKANVKAMFSRRPCFFVWGDDDSEAVSQGSAVLQCATDHKASLAVMMPRDNERIVAYNTTLLVLLLGVAGWNDGEHWLAQSFRAAAQHAQGGLFHTEHGALTVKLIVDRGHALTTLTIEETP
jgi:hypothetical protein